MLEIANHYQEITPAAVDRMYTALLAERAEHERELALSEQAADALEGVRHYAVADARLCNRIESECPDLRANVRYDTLYSYASKGDYQTSNWKVWTDSRHLADRSEYACVYVQLPRGHSVGDLIDALRANTLSREGLARATGQLEGMEELIDTEERLRAMVKEIENLRADVAQKALGASYIYFHDAVRDVLPALGGRR